MNCLKNNCEEIDKTRFEIKKIDNHTFVVKPTRRIMNFGDNQDDRFQVSVNGIDTKDYEYTKEYNKDTQEMLYKFKFNKTVKDGKIVMRVNRDPNNPLFDVNRNLLDNEQNSIEANITDSGQFICNLESGKRNKIKTIAIIVLALILLSIVILLVFTVLFFSKSINMIQFWKF